jgi:transcriptional regulator with XRE-family HTH domain
MVARNTLLTTPPYAVEQALKRLGGNLRTARLRRNLTVEEVAQKIGTGRRAIIDAEKGKPSAAVATYAALLWAFNLLGQLDAVADPVQDTEGSALALSRERSRARPGTGGMSNDF